jgi:hypothetical protein
MFRRNETGALAVEAALIFPVMVLILFGIIEFSLVFKDLQTTYSATRVGARTASAEPRQSSYASDVANAVTTGMGAIPAGQWRELWVYKAMADGMPDSGSFSSCTTCVRFMWDNTAHAWSKVQDTWPATGPGSQQACTAGSGPDSLGVYVKVLHPMLTPMFGTTKLLTDHTVTRLEPMPSGSCSG